MKQVHKIGLCHTDTMIQGLVASILLSCPLHSLQVLTTLLWNNKTLHTTWTKQLWKKILLNEVPRPTQTHSLLIRNTQA